MDWITAAGLDCQKLNDKPTLSLAEDFAAIIRRHYEAAAPRIAI